MRTIAGALFILSATAYAQQTPADRTIRDYVTARAKDLEKDFLPQVKTPADYEALRPRLRQQYLDMLGLWPLPEKTPLQATITGKLEQPGYTIEKLHFQSRPGLYVTANLYLPNPLPAGRVPAIVYQCGHSNMGRHGNKSAYQDHGIWFATHGYVCLVTDTLQYGEIGAIHHGTYREQRWWWHSAGYTSAGVECWNAIRAVDYLQSRPEVDPDRIGATGISGGGAATGWIAAADDRIKASAPVAGMSDLTWYVGEDGVNGHCDCMFLYNNYRWNWTTILSLACPRPMLFCNSDDDKIFPMPANERISNRMERLYSKYGQSDKFDTLVSVGGHAYRTDIRRSVFEFFNRTLKQDARPVTDPDIGLTPEGRKNPIIEPSRLRVFPEDKDIPADQLNTKIDETFVALAKPSLPKAGEFDAWRKDVLARIALTGVVWPGKSEIPLTQLTRLSGTSTKGSPVLLLLNPQDAPGAAPSWSKAAPEGTALLALPAGWTRKNPPNTIERSLALLGMTADSLRLKALLEAVESIEGSCHVAGQGATGIVAAYAALFNDKIGEVTIVDPPASHREGPYFLGILKACDIPEALGALAPRPLTLVNAKDPAFDRTAELYRLAGAADKLTRK